MENDTMTIGSYVLLRRLGGGAFGSVFLCKHSETHQSYAGKLFSLPFIKEEEGWLMIDQEVKILKQLTHHRTIKYQDIVYSPYGVLVVMELVDGRSLMDTYPEGGGYVESFARLIFKQLLEAVDFLHNNGIVHRDIKPENVMITKSGDLKLIDYGLAEDFPNSNGDRKQLLVNELIGSPNYYAPELLEGDANDKFRGDKVDIWATGVLLYTLVAYDCPFNGEGVDKIYEEILTRDVPFHNTGFSPELEDLVSMILVKDPEQRASIPDIMAHPWMKGKKTHSGCTTFYGKRGMVRSGMFDKMPELTRSCNATIPSKARNVRYNVNSRLYRSCNGRFVPEQTGKVMELKYPLLGSSSPENTESHKSSCKITPDECEGQSTKKMLTGMVNTSKKVRGIAGMNAKSEPVVEESDRAAQTRHEKRTCQNSYEGSDVENDAQNENNGRKKKNIFTCIVAWLCGRCCLTSTNS